MEDSTVLKYPTQELVLRQVESNKDFPLSGEMLVGREVECAIQLDSSQASRYHAKINVSTYGVYIEDLHSTNGTYINGKKIRGRVRLSMGDEIGFDSIYFRLTSPVSGRADSTVLAQKPKSMNKPTSIQSAQPDSLRHTNAVNSNVNNDSDKRNIDKLSSAHPERPNYEALENAARAKSRENQEKIAAAQAKPSIPIPEPFDDDEDTRMMSDEQIAHRMRLNQGDVEIDVGQGPRLIILTAPLRGKLFTFGKDLEPRTHWQLGRGKEAEICLNDQTISNDHARISQNPEGFTIMATHARNGISINGIPVLAPQVLLHNDKILIGRTEILFRSNYPDESDAIKETGNMMNRNTLIMTAVSVIVLVAALIFSAL